MNLKKNFSNQLSIYFSTCFGIGYFPFAPGTMGTLFAFIVWILIPDHIFYDTYLQIYKTNPFLIYTFIIALLSFIGVYTSSKAEDQLGHDSPKIIIDEFVGYMISVLFLPKTFMISIYAFVLFRVFDISKPFPIKQIQSLKKGWGVMADDVVAGIFSNLLIQILLYFFPRFFFHF